MKIITRLTLLALLSNLSFSAMSQDISATKKMMQEQMTATCNDKAFLACIGISKKKCTSSTTRAMSDCDHLFPKAMSAMNDTTMDTHGECVSDNILKNTGISSDKLDNCGPSSSAPPMDEAKIMEMMGKAMKQHAQSIETDRVTLPIYKNATVISHATAEIRTKMFGTEALAMVTLDSTDNVNQIASYYRSKLEGFREYKIENNILFLKNGPNDFDISKDFNKTLTTPNVHISPISGSISRIDIAYKE